ncbi:hypothetical protein T492DRAFT_367342 [Pavlovales sp. CCMP2436]|nr:hypothetical protein T492DRAFT_367342 [Pavlovales sp. CCMP2436]
MLLLITNSHPSMWCVLSSECARAAAPTQRPRCGFGGGGLIAVVVVAAQVNIANDHFCCCFYLLLYFIVLFILRYSAPSST